MMSRVQIDKILKYLFQMAGFSSILVLGGIFFMLLINGLLAFKDISIVEFFSSSIWSPSAYQQAQYGILAMVVSSILVTFLAMLIAVPIGIGTAVYLAEFAPKSIERIIKPSIEMLAAIPSVTIGFLGIVLLGPLLAKILGISQWVKCDKWCNTLSHNGTSDHYFHFRRCHNCSS